jgi:hypothetical protein
MGIMAQINANRASEHYVGRVLSGVITGAPADRWTSSYTSRDTALKAGISSTLVSGGSVLMQDVATFYHPDSVPVDSNGYAYQVNISKLQNISNSVKINFGQEKWQGNAIVADVSKVTSVIDREKTKDITAVQNDVVALAVAWASRSWIFNSSYTISEIQKGTYIEIRPGGTGFNIVIPILLSGVSRITNTEVKFDTSFAILTV